METLWFVLVAVMLVGLRGARRIRPRRRRHPPDSPRRTDEERRTDPARHRSGVGRQRSLAAGRRRHAVLRVSAALRLQLQRILSAADDGAVAADAARHRHRVSHPPAKARCGAASSTRSFPSSSILLAIFFGAALGNVVRGVPLNADGYFFEPLWTNWRIGAASGNSRLVHGDGRSNGAGHADHARRALHRAQDRRRDQ